MEKRIVKWCPDVIMSISEAKKLAEEYRQAGYEVEELIFPIFRLLLDDGYVLIFWEDGSFYSQCFPYDDVKAV